MIIPDNLSETLLCMRPWLIGGMAVNLMLAWRWRWRDYLLPWSLNRELQQNMDSRLETPSTGVSENGLSAFARPLPRVSVVIPCCNQADTLRKNLPAILGQKISAFEVIIADEASTDETRELVNHLSSEYPNLRYTFVPESSRYVDRRKLAITLGVRAARSPWIILTEADCQPASESWLELMSSHFSDELDFVLGYANYVNDGSRAARSAIYERLQRQLIRYRAAVGTRWMWKRQQGVPFGRAFGGDIANMAVRKSWFLTNKGYEDSLTVSCGEDDLLVDALSRKSRTAVEVRPEATVLQNLPSQPIMVAQQAAHRETLSRLSRRGLMFRYRESAATWVSWFFGLLFVSYLLLRIAFVIDESNYLLEDIPYDVIVVLLAALCVCLPGWFMRRCVDSLGERHFCWIGMSLRALVQPFYTLNNKMRHFKRRHDFVRR